MLQSLNDLAEITDPYRFRNCKQSELYSYKFLEQHFVIVVVIFFRCRTDPLHHVLAARTDFSNLVSCLFTGCGWDGMFSRLFRSLCSGQM